MNQYQSKKEVQSEITNLEEQLNKLKTVRASFENREHLSLMRTYARELRDLGITKPERRVILKNDEETVTQMLVNLPELYGALKDHYGGVHKNALSALRFTPFGATCTAAMGALCYFTFMSEIAVSVLALCGTAVGGGITYIFASEAKDLVSSKRQMKHYEQKKSMAEVLSGAE